MIVPNGKENIMPQVLLTVLATLGKVLMSLLASLLTETFLKRTILAGVETLSKKTAADFDDKLAAAMREAWFPSESAPSSGESSPAPEETK
jgi:hypothetical protein